MTAVPPGQWHEDYIPTLDDWQSALSTTAAADRVSKSGDLMSGTLNVVTSGLATAINVVQVGSGTANYVAYNEWPHAGFAYNYKMVTCQVALASDSIAVGRGIVIADAVDYHIGGANVNGARLAHGAFLTVTSPVSSGAQGEYIGASWSFAQSAAPVIGSSSGTPLGALYGGNDQVQLYTGATNYINVMGREIDVEINTGASSKFKWGLLVTTIGNDTVHGSSGESALHVGAVPSSGGWNNGLTFSGFNGGVPISTTGSVISTNCPWGGTWTALHGVDLRGITLTGYAFAVGANINSPIFTISGAGNITGQTALFSTLNVAGDVAVGGNLSEVGNITVAGKLNLTAKAPPASAGATGFLGDVILGTDNFLYVCIATNTWRRVPLSAW